MQIHKHDHSPSCSACGSSAVKTQFRTDNYVPIGYGTNVELPRGFERFPHLRITCSNCGYLWAMHTRTINVEGHVAVDTK